MYEIILGRNETDLKAFGNTATIFLGKHYIEMERVKSLANPVLLDVNRPHVLLVVGKRGGGKSHTLGVIAEGISKLERELANNLSCILFDTMGIYWTMKYPNYKDDILLSEWKIKPVAMKPKVFVPSKLYSDYEKKGLPVDAKFSIAPYDLEPSDWNALFKFEMNSNEGVLIERAISAIKESYSKFRVEQIIAKIKKDERASEDEKNIVITRFESVEKWNLFEEQGTGLTELMSGGQISILDLSAYSQLDDGQIIKDLVISFICKNILKQRFSARKVEELSLIREDLSAVKKKKMPLVWLMLDEAHEFLPREGSTLATMPLIQIIREGRQPGLSLVLATQQPGKIHTDVMTQADVVLSHRLTSKIDVEALNEIMQSYLPFALQKYLDNLPRVKGAAIALDDNSEKIYPIQVRPRQSWHGGEDPAVIRHTLKKSIDSKL